MARYLLAASPLAGHVAPMLQIAVDLRRRGHDVCLMADARFVDEVHGAGIEADVLPRAARVPSPPQPKSGVPSLLRHWRSGSADLQAVFIAPLAAQHQALQARLCRERVDAVMVDLAFTGVLPLLLNGAARPPVLVCGLGPLTLSSADTPPFGMAWQPQPGRNYTQMTRVAHSVLFSHTQARFNRMLRSVGAEPSPVFITDWPMLADKVLQLTVPAFEYARSDLPANVVFTGPVLADASQPHRAPDWWGAVRTARTVVHVTQGTWHNTNLEQLINPTLTALADTDVTVVATTGDPETSTSAAPAPNAYVTDYVPYAHLLPHVDVMVTNGGYGGVQHALRHGVPLVVAADGADKPEIAARVTYSGAGISLGTARPTPDAIRAAVRHVLDTPGYRAAAARLSGDIAASRPFDTIADALSEVTPGPDGPGRPTSLDAGSVFPHAGTPGIKFRKEKAYGGQRIRQG